MQHFTLQVLVNKAVDYFESFQKIKQLHSLSPEGKDQFLHDGFSFEQVQNLMDVIDIDTVTLCFILNISGFEYKEILKEKLFSREMCIKILAVAEVYAYGYHAFQCRRSFNSWMKAEVIFRGVISNLSFLCSSDGIKKIIEDIKRMECGTF